MGGGSRPFRIQAPRSRQIAVGLCPSDIGSCFNASGYTAKQRESLMKKLETAPEKMWPVGNHFGAFATGRSFTALPGSMML